MASILQIGDKWRAQVRRRNHKPQARTFRTKAEALAWARAIESRIDAGQEPKATSLVRVRDVLAAYRQLREDGGRPIEPTTNQHYVLEHLAEDLGHEKVADLTPQRLVQWAGMRKEQGAGPFTVNMELSALGTVLRHAAAFMNAALPDVTGAARPLLLHLQLIGAGQRRTRTPTEDELQAVLAWVRKQDPVVADAMRVAAITGLRRSELVRKLLWADIDPKQKAALIRQRKHPRRHLARDEWVPLLGDAWDIVQKQKRTGERVFPISPEKITDAFTAATRALGIPDLRLHDLRHYASTKLQQAGFDEVERMAITGHRSVAMNARYTHPTPEHLHAKYQQATAPRKRAKRATKRAAR
jgi:integrase